jgi:hypothetical protein
MRALEKGVWMTEHHFEEEHYPKVEVPSEAARMTEPKQPWQIEADRKWKLRQQREEWEQQRKLREEQEEREKKQAGLESAMRERDKLWRQYTGEEPTPEQLMRWREEYIEMRAAEEELEREERRQQRRQRAMNQDHYPGANQ